MKLLFSILILLLGFYLNGQTNVEYWLQARMNGVYELENGTEVEFWGYGDNTPPLPGNKIFLPGPILRFKEGDSAVVHFKNNSPEMHTIHFHGLDVNQANDGVGHTSQDILPNQTFDYKFKCTHAGTFLYHCHVLTTLHLAMGMYGTVVVDPASGPGSLIENTPSYLNEYTLLSSEFDLDWNMNPMSPGPFQLYEASRLMINGKSAQQLLNGEHDINGVINQYTALRLANIGYGFTRFSFPQELEVQVIMSDGRVLPNPVNLNEIDLYPGERFDVLVKSQTQLDTVINIAYFDLRNNNLLGNNSVPIKIGDAEIQQHNFNQLHFWPNPSNGTIICNNLTSNQIPFILESFDGKFLESKLLSPGKSQVEFYYPPGIYILRTELNSFKIVLE